jgi:hypothetical protein
MLEVSDRTVHAPTVSSCPDRIRLACGGLNSIERSVVMLSRADPLSSLPDRHPYRAGISRLLWIRTSNQIANPRLEALRRHAVVLRIHGHANTDDDRRFGEAGFDAHHAATVERIVAPWRTCREERAQFIPWAIVALAAAPVHWLISDAIGEPTIGLVITGLLVVSLAPFLVHNKAR